MAVVPAIVNGNDSPDSRNTPEIADIPPVKIPTLNILDVVLGSLIIKPWYSSEWYPEELIGQRIDRLFVCQWCFKYTKELVPFLQHLKTCPLRCSPPPGTLKYAKSGLSIYSLDGLDHKLYAQNLSLFAKLFLHVKSVFYDVSAFQYYLLVLDDPSPSIPNTLLGGGAGGESAGQVVGFFSKEKLSWDNNNLNCICIFPPWQKQGLAQVLIAASYELGRKEGRMGGPEKPLSTHGYAAYTHYWSTTLARTILARPASAKKLTIADLAEETSITADDIQNTLGAMGVLERRTRAGCRCVVNRARVRAWIGRNKVRLENPVDPGAFVEDLSEEEGEEGESEEEEEE